jgi:hypothetical protein
MTATVTPICDATHGFRSGQVLYAYTDPLSSRFMHRFSLIVLRFMHRFFSLFYNQSRRAHCGPVTP